MVHMDGNENLERIEKDADGLCEGSFILEDPDGGDEPPLMTS